VAAVQLRPRNDRRRVVTLPSNSSPSASAGQVSPARTAGVHDVALIDLLDRLLQGGVAIQGDITLSAAGVDLVEVDLRLLVAAVDKAAGR
jgi:Gas vesicle protein